MQKDRFSSASVYKRMLQTAAETWGVRESDLTGLDPSYKLLLNALAKEVEGVGNELKGAESRILKRLAGQLMPYAMQSVVPAHGVVHFTPTENVEITAYDHFKYDKRWLNKEKFNRQEVKTVHFTAATPVDMIPASLQFRLEQGVVSAVHGLNNEELDLRSPVENHHSIVLGISRLENRKFSIYFDWFKDEEKKGLFMLLDKVRVTNLDGTPLPTERGLAGTAEADYNLEEKLNPMNQLERLIVNYYQNRFLTIDVSHADENSGAEDLSGPYRETIDELDPDAECRWIALHFPDEVGANLVHDVFLQLNCFPVLNRKMERQVVRLQPDLNIKKLDFEGAFLNVERVESNEGVRYSEIKHMVNELNNPGTFAVRRAGIGRLDDREATEYLTYLLDLIKDEKQAFASVDASGTSADLQKIDQAFRRVEKKVEAAGLRNKRPYIMLTPQQEYENVYIYFWSTDADFANGIPKESVVECNTAGISMTGSAVLMTDIIGGEQELSDKLLVDRYKNALLTKDAIVTRADIVSHCRTIGAGRIERVDVKKETLPSSLRKNGLMQVLSIYITFKTGERDPAKKNYMLQRLESELLSKSNFSIPVNVKEAHD
ncbi:MAG: hypothetical protein LC670_03330 [Flavobacteriales bacterium]|nr:hypothetical protein [Flavobacteriales bacterium]